MKKNSPDLINLVSLAQNKIKPKIRFLGLALILTLLVFAKPVLAHHAIGGQTPGNLVDGFLSGLAHPVIGADHLVFVIAVGLLAALKNNKGILIPVAFVVATVAWSGPLRTEASSMCPTPLTLGWEIIPPKVFALPLKFLREIKLGQRTSLPNKIAVIGGGSVAIDVAMSSIRLGAEPTVIVRGLMRAPQEEIDEAVEEGVNILSGWATKDLVLRCRRRASIMRFGKYRASNLLGWQ